ncbi:MAG: NAD(P)H-quinone oxidoreductase [Vicinamibacteria bacterium]|nr:NAD(P)H-quinone oxidoreductase [Vicinamibacteria bacterium]
MKAVEIAEPGGPEVLRVVERDIPRLGASDVLIRVSAAGVNRPDLLQREGKYPPPSGVTDIPGLEVSGVVVSVGSDVAWPRVGDSVMALVPGGGYAEYCAAPAGSCLRIPAGYSSIDAAAVPETFFTVWANVFESARLQPDETFLVHGGSSGIGTAAVQMVKALGGRPFATARGPRKCAAVEALGALRCIDSTTHDFVKEMKDLTEGRGVDVILDMLGGDCTQRNLQALAFEGRLVQIATLLGTRAEVNMGMIMQKRLTLTGSTLRSRPDFEKARIARAVADRVVPHMESGAIRPVIHMTFPLEAAGKAHTQLEEGNAVGKIVLIVG